MVDGLGARLPNVGSQSINDTGRHDTGRNVQPPDEKGGTFHGEQIPSNTLASRAPGRFNKNEQAKFYAYAALNFNQPLIVHVNERDSGKIRSGKEIAYVNEQDPGTIRG